MTTSIVHPLNHSSTRVLRARLNGETAFEPARNTKRIEQSPQAYQDGTTKLSTGLVRSESGSLMLESRSQ